MKVWKDFLRNFNSKSFAKSKKKRTFANDDYDEPTALAFTDFTKESPTLKGEDAIRFIERMEAVNKEYEKRKNEPPSLEQLKKEYSIGMMLLEMDKKSIEERELKLKELKNKIKVLEKENGKAEEE